MVDPPPRCMRSEHWKESSRLYSRDSQQVLVFGVESGVAFNVLTTGLFRIHSQVTSQLPRYAYRNTKSSWQSKELTTTRPRTPDLVIRHDGGRAKRASTGSPAKRAPTRLPTAVFICPSSVHHFARKCEATILPITSNSKKGTLGAIQKHKVGERLKASPKAPMTSPFYQEVNHQFD